MLNNFVNVHTFYSDPFGFDGMDGCMILTRSLLALKEGRKSLRAWYHFLED